MNTYINLRLLNRALIGARFSLALLSGNPLLAQGSVLSNPIPAAGAELGYALATDGERVVTGVPGAAARAGAVRIYQCNAGQCASTALIAPNDLVSGDLFGRQLALSGNSLAISAPSQAGGAVYVFVFDGANWTQQARIQNNAGDASAGFGSALALAGDQLLIGANQADSGAGAAYMYTRDAGVWTVAARISAEDASPGADFAASLALQGSTLLVGAPQYAVAPGDYARGAAYVFVQQQGTWVQQARLLATPSANGDRFGSALSLSGERALISAPLSAAGTGSAYVYERSGGTWTQQAQFNGLVAGERFGWSVALDGDAALIGAPFALGSCGSTHLYKRNLGVWQQQAGASTVTASLGSLNGWAVAIAGQRLLSGAPGYSGAADHRGAAYWFDPLEQLFADGFGVADEACVAAK